MLGFEIESLVSKDAKSLYADLLTMNGVNYELIPLVRMTAPSRWAEKPIQLWPIDEALFTSVILLFGIIPVDLHRFKLLGVNGSGFEECSCSLVNEEWRHSRTIKEVEGGSLVKDQVTFIPKIRFVGKIMKPIYEAIFKHRHKRLVSRYVTGS
ncbi:MAG: hypothetical protein AAF197_04020 [Pseudomonadota bacterium]